MKGMMKAAAPMVARTAQTLRQDGVAPKLTPRDGGPAPNLRAGWASFRQPGDQMRAGWDAHFNRTPSRPDGSMVAPMQPSPPVFGQPPTKGGIRPAPAQVSTQPGQPSRAQQLMQAFAQARR